ncbi:MAG: hypothetical protein HY997_04780 [Mycolicibacterium neoaurum]|nr:hypothetical protein [Mycolicibacterium neoaurum]
MPGTGAGGPADVVAVGVLGGAQGDNADAPAEDTGEHTGDGGDPTPAHRRAMPTVMPGRGWHHPVECIVWGERI